jgi:hypothetical protein
MTWTRLKRTVVLVSALTTMSVPAFGQVELSGSYAIRMYEDYIERGPGSYMGDFTGMPMSDEGRAKALSYTSSLPSTIERQCLAQSPWVGQYRPLGLRIWSEVDDGRVVAWVLGGDYLRDTIRIWMDGRSHPSPNAWHPPAGFTTGHWEGDTLVAHTTHVKAAWIRRGVGIPGSDRSEFTVMITRHDNLLTLTTVQEDPVYLTEPHVVSRVWEFDPNGSQEANNRGTCNTGNEIPSLEDTGKVPHYLPEQNPEEEYMVRTYNIPKDAALGFAYTLYPEYRKTLKNLYTPPASCGRYCCGWIERQGLPGAAPGLTCKDNNQPPAVREEPTIGRDR